MYKISHLILLSIKHWILTMNARCASFCSFWFTAKQQAISNVDITIKHWLHTSQKVSVHYYHIHICTQCLCSVHFSWILWIGIVRWIFVFFFFFFFHRIAKQWGDLLYGPNEWDAYVLCWSMCICAFVLVWYSLPFISASTNFSKLCDWLLATFCQISAKISSSSSFYIFKYLFSSVYFVPFNLSLRFFFFFFFVSFHFTVSTVLQKWKIEYQNQNSNNVVQCCQWYNTLHEHNFDVRLVI